MAYKSTLQEVPSNLTRTVLGTFDFRGRSTRTELWTYLIVGQFIVSVIALALEISRAGSFSDELSTPQLIALGLGAAPVPALFARRLHDIGWSGWFALGVPIVCFVGVFTEDTTLQVPGFNQYEIGVVGSSIYGTYLLFMIVVALLHTGLGNGDYGPDPRAD